MPEQYLRDLADIAAGRPIADEDLEASHLESDWVRRPDRDFGGMAIWQLPNGTFIAVASPTLRSQLRNSPHSATDIGDGQPDCHPVEEKPGAHSRPG